MISFIRLSLVSSPLAFTRTLCYHRLVVHCFHVVIFFFFPLLSCFYQCYEYAWCSLHLSALSDQSQSAPPPPPWSLRGFAETSVLRQCTPCVLLSKLCLVSFNSFLFRKNCNMFKHGTFVANFSLEISRNNTIFSNGSFFFSFFCCCCLLVFYQGCMKT